eukprot:Skav231883  [mRNA]  locus=scaffold54:327470:330326:- [translate_table: standard]
MKRERRAELQAGSLLVKLPLPPGTFPTLWKNDAGSIFALRGFRKAYLEAFPGYFSTGDAGVIDEHGYVTVLERNLGSRDAEMPHFPAQYIDVNDCAVIGAADQVKGQVKEVKEKVRHDIGAIASLAGAAVVEQLPKTRSGKARGLVLPLNPPALDFALDALKRMGFAKGL